MVWSFAVNQLRKSLMTSQPEQPSNNQQSAVNQQSVNNRQPTDNQQSANNQQPDTEQDAHYMRVIIALFVPVVVLAIALPLLWNVTDQGESENENTSAIHYMLSKDQLSAEAADAGYTATGDDVTTILLAVTPQEESQLSKVALISVNDTQSAAKLLEIDPTAQVACDNLTESLNDTYQSSGAQGVAYVVAHAGFLSVDHIVEMDSSSWDIVRNAVEQGSDSLAVDIAQLLEGIKENDMSVRTIREVLTRATTYGFSAGSIVQVPAKEASSDGTTQLDAPQIGILAGSIK